MADVAVPSIATATPAAADTVVGVQGGAVKRFALSGIGAHGAFSHSGTYAAGSLGAKAQEVVSVKDAPYSATGDGTTDDTAAIQAAIDSLTGGSGGVLYVPPGYYRVTATINVGSEIYDAYDWLVGRTAPADSTGHSISANVTSNRALSHVDIVFAPGAFLVADFAPETPTPVLAYNLMGAYTAGHGGLYGAAVMSMAMLIAGVYNYNAVAAPQTNNLIGIFFASGCKVVEKVLVSGLEHGVASHAAHWTRLSDVRAEWIGGDCVSLGGARAITVENVVMWSSARGVVFDGDASAVRGVHTEHVAEDLIIFKADACVFGPGYLEDVSASDGTGTYAITLGYVEDGNHVTSCRFDGLRVGSARPNKGGLRSWGARSATYVGCRLYSKTWLKDSAGSMSLLNCDFGVTVPTARVYEESSGAITWSSNHPTGTSYTVNGPWMFTISGIAPGSIAAGGSANHDYALPAALAATSVNKIVAHATYNSGGNALLGVTVRALASPNRIRLTFANPTSGAIDPGSFNMALVVFAGV